jgi:hypothetical protein
MSFSLMTMEEHTVLQGTQILGRRIKSTFQRAFVGAQILWKTWQQPLVPPFTCGYGTSLVPRGEGREGLVTTACACVNFSVKISIH